jgi:arabinogalactan oligomer/maltooligosaccharide transport system substrate-binding protein
MNENGEWTGIDDTFNSAEGLIAMKGMQKLAQSPAYDSNADIFTDAAVVITGIWNAGAAEEHFGANLAATDLPSFTVDGTSYHLGGFTGYKLMGVKPQTDAKRGAVLSLLAQYLTGEECQLQRAETFQWGPSNLEAAKSEAVQSNVSLAAFAKQAASENCVPQGQIHGAWWDIAKVLGADAKNATSDADLQTALDNYKNAIDEVVKLPPEVRRAWTVIGSVGNTNWDTDFAMTETETNTWLSNPIEMKAGNEFKVRQGLAWNNNFGVEFNGANIVVEADGKYQVKFVWDGDKTAEITLVPVE